MAVLRLEIVGNPVAVKYRDFVKVANDGLYILDDLDQAFSRRSNAALDWYMHDLSKNGRLRLELYSKVRPMKRKVLEDVSQRVVSSFVDGFKTVEEKGKSPAYLTEYGISKAKEMTTVIGTEGTQKIIASAPELQSEVEITERSAKTLAELLPTPYRSIGSVEGFLETVSVHNGHKFIVYEGKTGKAVTCHFPRLRLMERVKESLGKRVIVSGLLARNPKNEPVRITISKDTDFRVFDEDLKVLPFKDLGGSDPDFTGSVTTEEFIRRIRG